jgi:hypothetical protein
MNGILKDLYTCMKEEKSIFNVLSDEDLRNLSVFFESRNIPAGKIFMLNFITC